MKVRYRLIHVLVMALSCGLSSCGYRYGESSLSSSYQTISIPFVSGDPDGELTAAIVRQLTGVLSLQYRQDCGQLQLNVAIVNFDDENIGYRYSYKKSHKRSHTIVPVESRMHMTVEVTLVDTTSQCVLYEPVRLKAYIDIDHDYNYSTWKRGVTQFSLGQLTDADAAFEASRAALNQEIAVKISMYLNSL